MDNKSGKGTRRFAETLASARNTSGALKLDGLLSGVVCWFVRGYSPSNHPDADNISKGIWDILDSPKAGDAPGRTRLGLYDDDKQIRLRVAAVYDFSPEKAGPALRDLDLAALPADVSDALDKLLSASPDDAAFRHLTLVRIQALSLQSFNSCCFGSNE